MQTEEEIKRPEETPKLPDKKDESTASMLYDWADALVYALIAIVLLFTLVFRTLYENDKLIISNILYEPEPGDIVVVTKRSFREEPIVKRVIAVAGQTVDLAPVTGAVYIDGVLLKEDYVSEKLTYEFGDMQFPLYVEEGHIFVMGDNRNHSTDSRNVAVGLVDTRMVLGKVLFRIFPFTSIGSVYE